MCSLVVARCGPRVRIPSFFCRVAGRTSAARRNDPRSSLVSSRTSPSGPIRGFLRVDIAFYLAAVGLAETNDAQAGLSLGEHEPLQTSLHVTRHYVAGRAVFFEIVNL